MNKIIKSLKDLQESIAMAAPTYATNMEIVRRIEAIIEEANKENKMSNLNRLNLLNKENKMSGASYPQGCNCNCEDLIARIEALEAKEAYRAEISKTLSINLEQLREPRDKNENRTE